MILGEHVFDFLYIFVIYSLWRFAYDRIYIKSLT